MLTPLLPWRLVATRIRPRIGWSVSYHRTRALARGWGRWMGSLGWMTGVDRASGPGARQDAGPIARHDATAKPQAGEGDGLADGSAGADGSGGSAGGPRTYRPPVW